jgi:hypothetical protein
MQQFGLMPFKLGGVLRELRVFDEDSVVARIRERAGYRYQSSTLAQYFGVKTAEMTVMLHALHQAGMIRAILGGSHSVFYLPSAEELRLERAAAMCAKRFDEVPALTGYEAGMLASVAAKLAGR